MQSKMHNTPKTNTSVVFDFPKSHVISPVENTAKRVPTEVDIAAAALGDQRVQIRMPLENLDQTEAAITLLQGALSKSMTQIRRARSSGDLTALVAVRQLLSTANRHINAYERDRANRKKSGT